MNTRRNKIKQVRLLVPTGELPTARFTHAVCSGDVPKPKHGCEWVVHAFVHKSEVVRVKAEIEPKLGCAVVELSYKGLVLVALDNTVLNDGGLTTFKRSMTRQIGKPVDIVIPLYDDSDRTKKTGEATIKVLPVGNFFAVHRALEKGVVPETGVFWAVTHRTSGLCAASHVKGRVLAAAIAVVLQELPIPWGKNDPFGCGFDPEVAKRAKQISREFRDLESVRQVIAREQELALERLL